MSEVFPQALLDSLLTDGSAVAFEHAGSTVTRAELRVMIGRFVTGLRAAGVRPGAVVAISTAVTVAGFAVQQAAHVLGCRVIGIRPGLSASQLRHILEQDVEVVLADDPAEQLLAGPLPVLRVGPELLGSFAEPVPCGRPEDIAVLTFTSGSTGNPKGVALSYGALTEHWSWQPARWSARTLEWVECYGRFLMFGTLTSAVMQEHLALCLLSGGTVVIPDELPDFPFVIERLQITACLLTVPRLHQVLDILAEREVDLSSLRSVLVAGSPLSAHRQQAYFDRFGAAARQGYGQTETGMLTLLDKADLDAWPPAIASVGRVCAEVELQIRDETGEPAETGELWVRTPWQLSGYWCDDAETAQVLREGWVRTRDLGRVDERGFVYLTGRARDVIIVNAIIHYAGPIEAVLASHPDVDQAYLVGVPDEFTGEAAHAFVVASAGRKPNLAELRALVAERLGQASVPASITVIDDVPIGPAGKPDKLALRARLG